MSVFNAATDLREVAAGVYYATSAFVQAGPDLIAFLKDAAARSPLKRARLCAHAGPDDLQHDMVIVSHRSTYVPPHRHRTKSESLVVLEGRALAFLFDDHGDISQCLPLAPLGGQGAHFYRMPAGTYHSMVILDEWLVFTEATSGPFSRQDSEIPTWAPGQQEVEAGRAYAARLLERVASVPHP